MVSLCPSGTELGNVQLCIGYNLPTIWGICVSGIYMLRLDILCQHLGEDCNLKGIMSHLRILNSYLHCDLRICDYSISDVLVYSKY